MILLRTPLAPECIQGPFATSTRIQASGYLRSDPVSQSELDPRMTLHVGLAPPKRGQQPTPEEFLDAMRAELMEGMQLDEEEWEQHVAGALEGFDEARAALVAPPIPVGVLSLVLASY